MPSHQKTNSLSQQTTTSTGSGNTKALPDIAAKWGITPQATNSKTHEKVQPESEYSLEEQKKRAKLRAKGINPDLKAEMDANVRGSKGGGFWSKFAGTSTGGGWIK